MTPTIAEDILALKVALVQALVIDGDFAAFAESCSADRIGRLLAHIANLEVREIHTCHDDCKKDGCVNRRLRERVEVIEAENYARKLDSTRTYDGLVQRVKDYEVALELIENGENAWAHGVARDALDEHRREQSECHRDGKGMGER